MSNMAKTERGISIMVFFCCTAQEIWDMEEAELEKQCINNITPEILKKFQGKQRLPPTRKLSAIDLLLVPEDIVWNEGATQMGRGCGIIWVTKHE